MPGFLAHSEQCWKSIDSQSAFNIYHQSTSHWQVKYWVDKDQLYLGQVRFKELFNIFWNMTVMFGNHYQESRLTIWPWGSIYYLTMRRLSIEHGEVFTIWSWEYTYYLAMGKFYYLTMSIEHGDVFTIWSCEYTYYLTMGKFLLSDHE